MVIVYQVDDHTIYVGVDQFENEELIHFTQRFMEQSGLTLMWYHVDKFSSPHAYVRLHENETTVPKKLADICCQICKDGSIEGTKHPAVDVVYTVATNLMKTKGMNPGQVSFHNRKLMHVEHGVRKNNQILKYIATVRSECTVKDLEQELEDIVANKKKSKNSANQADDDWGGDDFDDGFDENPKKKVKVSKNGVQQMLDNIPKAEFNTNMEDDFM
ncbi:Coiled-coil domain-containing protein 25 [Tritrichomonas musculus]|uniref:Coiled-coil domain-containing protein 25 n=1 Tax=Tritrichomonas musculus TaxID=1915356 RepID=A0ABR2K5I8_9EUKA